MYPLEEESRKQPWPRPARRTVCPSPPSLGVAFKVRVYLGIKKHTFGQSVVSTAIGKSALTISHKTQSAVNISRTREHLPGKTYSIPTGMLCWLSGPGL